jgi:predicted  nucleic acid-binding Zn-ribbon protein
MFSAEVLSQLRSLNWLAQEISRVPAGSVERAHLLGQIEAVRARLPNALLAHHDQLAARGRPSTVPIQAGACGTCGEPLATEVLAELAAPGRFGVCPHCGVFLWLPAADAGAGAASRSPSSPAVAPNTPRLET